MHDNRIASFGRLVPAFAAKPVQACVGRLGLPSGDGRELALTTPTPSARRLGRRCCLGEEVWEELVGLGRQVSWNVWRVTPAPRS